MRCTTIVDTMSELGGNCGTCFRFIHIQTFARVFIFAFFFCDFGEGEFGGMGCDKVKSRGNMLNNVYVLEIRRRPSDTILPSFAIICYVGRRNELS